MTDAESIVAALNFLTEQVKRLADQGEPAIITPPERKEAEFGRASYGDIQRREQTEELQVLERDVWEHGKASPPPNKTGAKTKPAR